MVASAIGGLKPEHPRMWEYQVQETIRELRVPLKRPWFARIGLQADGSAGAVQVTQEIDAGEHYDLAYGAVALNLQGRRLFIGDEMMRDTIELITARSVELGAPGSVILTTKVHHENSNSQKMVLRHGFKNLGSLEDDDHDDWECELALPVGLDDGDH